MQIVVNDQLKDAIEWTCKYANEYKVDIDIHIDADGEVSVSVCPTYRDRDTADTPQTETPCDGYVCDDGKHLMYCMNCKGIAWKTEPPKVEDEPQTERSSEWRPKMDL